MGLFQEVLRYISIAFNIGYAISLCSLIAVTFTLLYKRWVCLSNINCDYIEIDFALQSTVMEGFCLPLAFKRLRLIRGKYYILKLVKIYICKGSI